MVENLKELKLHYESLARDQELQLPAWRKRRLLYVLKKAKLFKILDVDSSQDGAEELLLQIYHNLLGFSLKGFSVILIRDVAEIFVNKYNPEWLAIAEDANDGFYNILPKPDNIDKIEKIRDDIDKMIDNKERSSGSTKRRARLRKAKDRAACFAWNSVH